MRSERVADGQAKLVKLDPPIARLYCDGKEILPGDEYDPERTYLVWEDPLAQGATVVTYEVKRSGS